jgi:hypothetical protein
MENYKTTARLNLRSSPQAVPQTLMTTLLPDTLVTKVADSKPGWMQVIVPVLNTKGFVFASYLNPTTEAEVPAIPEAPKIPFVHLKPQAGTDSKRLSINARAFPLNELNLPSRNTTNAQASITSIHSIVTYLDVEHSLRYGPTEAHTYCNIYAYDFCFLSGVYMPRVWWTRSAIANLALGTAVPVLYGISVNEVNANSLHDWFIEFSSQYGWTRVLQMNELQDSVSKNGRVGIITGQRVNLNTAGHITCVVPETSSMKAERDANGNVIRPLQSQAGRNNHNYFVGNWWSNPASFRAFGFWIHD